MVLTAAEPTRAALAPLERAVLLTLVYSDLFDYPLTAAELRRYLPVRCADADLDAALDALGGQVERHGGYLCLAGREAIAGVRWRRAALAGERWRAARRFAAWLRRVPFLRMVAVCGSQAVDNGGEDGDVDLFLITEPRRLWIVQSIVMALRRLGRRRFGVAFCPNYLTTRERLTIEDHNLYTAREIVQAVPLWGEGELRRFVDANRWVARFMPQADLERGTQEGAERRRGALERLLGGRLGDALDAAVYRALLVYYRLRLRRRGWRRDDVERAYRRDRQALIADGYAGAVARAFVERAAETLARAGEAPTAQELARVFYGGAVPSGAADPHFAGLFHARYGGRR
jgi:hypothetical protein